METFSAQALIEISDQLPEGEEDDGWMGYLEADGIAAIPYPFRSVLFRGQNKRYRPFLPSIARGLNSNTGKMFEMAIEDQAKLVLRLAQSWWFAREVDHHPLTHYAKQENIHLNRLARAQHYEIPTGYLDLTHSFDVAAFFATCRRTPSGWEPIGDSEPEPGIVYRVEFDRMKNALELFMALGPQPLPRPYEQRAWVAELPLVDSFDGWPIVFVIQFKHNESVSVGISLTNSIMASGSSRPTHYLTLHTKS